MPSPTAQAQEILQRARQQAEAVLHEARRDAEQIRADAAREGFSDGQMRACEEMAGERERLCTLLDQVGAAFHQFCRDQMPALAALAAEAAEKLMAGQLAAEPERITAIVQHALDHVTASSWIIVRLHPEDLELVRADTAPATAPAGDRTPRSAPMLSESAHPCTHPGEQTLALPGCLPVVHLHADATVERGGCRIESEQGEVDATVSGRVARLADALREVA
jgi:flagellar assembly protein FliH